MRNSYNKKNARHFLGSLSSSALLFCYAATVGAVDSLKTSEPIDLGGAGGFQIDPLSAPARPTIPMDELRRAHKWCSHVLRVVTADAASGNQVAAGDVMVVGDADEYSCQTVMDLMEFEAMR